MELEYVVLLVQAQVAQSNELVELAKSYKMNFGSQVSLGDTSNKMRMTRNARINAEVYRAISAMLNSGGYRQIADRFVTIDSGQSTTSRVLIPVPDLDESSSSYRIENGHLFRFGADRMVRAGDSGESTTSLAKPFSEEASLSVVHSEERPWEIEFRNSLTSKSFTFDIATGRAIETDRKYKHP